MRQKMLFLMLLLLPLSLFAKGNGGEGLGDVFNTLASMAAAVPVVTEVLKNLFNTSGGWGSRLISWITGVAMAFFGWQLSMGMLEGLIWWQMLLVGVGGSLVANGVFDTGIVTGILQVIGIYTNKKEK